MYYLLDHFKRLVGAIQFGGELSTRSVHCGAPATSHSPNSPRVAQFGHPFFLQLGQEDWTRNSAQQLAELRCDPHIILTHDVCINAECEARITLSHPLLSDFQRNTEPITSFSV